MKHTEKELAKNISDNLRSRLDDAEKYKLPYVELTLSTEQARWLGRKMLDFIENKPDPFFEDNPYNFEYDLPEEKQVLPIGLKSFMWPDE